MPLQTTFGNEEPERQYTLRPSAYALLLDEQGCLAVVEAPDGYFLPGGGIESGESAQDAVLREISEETGQGAHVLWHLAEADQFIGEWLKRSSFYLAELDPEPESVGEYQVHWLIPEQAQTRLTYESHRWMVERFAPYLRA
ncbi:MAG: NUDIX domain-containing protein [Candidatus Sericytochromatia bacterium]